MKRLFRWIRNAALIALLGILGWAGWAYNQDPVLVGRLLSFGGDSGPAQAVEGGKGIEIPPVRPEERRLSNRVISEIIQFGEITNSHALLVHQGGALQLEQYYGNQGPDTRTPSQSMHKSVLALLVGLAIEDGFIRSADDPASDYLQEWRGDDREGITLQNMLQQSSGISFPTVGPNIVGDFYQLVLGGNIAPIVLKQTAERTPNSQFDYNSINPQALGMMIERATGSKYWDYLSKALWSKVAQDKAFVRIDSEDNLVARTFCCLEATAMDWLRVGLLHLNKGRVGATQVVPEDWMDAIVTPSETNPNYGYLTWLGTEYNEFRYYNTKASTSVPHSEPFAADDVIYFDGFGGQRVYIVPSLELVIVRLGEIYLDWDEARLPNLVINGIDPNWRAQ